jgi:modulator of FtsH protease
VSGYVASEWNEFCVAVLGAAAALSGLLFASVAINIERIMAQPRLPSRALQTLILFVVPVVLCICVLTPHQPRGVLGTELIVTGALAGAVLLSINRPAQRGELEPRAGWLVSRFLARLLVSLFLFVAGITLILQAGGGLYWIAPATLLAVLAGLANTWVLLVEILR